VVTAGANPHVILWEFRVRPGSETAFESAYGPAGDWARLFRQAHGYLGTELLRDCQEPDRYLTLDRWASREAFECFHRERRKEYEALDRQCEGLTASEVRLGSFSAVPGPE
jgi:heme-degrading monooxygenase HmoA